MQRRVGFNKDEKNRMLLSSQTRLGLRMTGKEIYVKKQVHVLTIKFLDGIQQVAQ